MYKKKYTKRPVVRNPTSSADRAQVGFTNSYVPALSRPKFYGKLRYGVAQLSFSSVTNTVGTYVFSANGCFDPNITGGALAPAGFSQLISLYEHYTVYQSRISVIFTSNSSQPAMCGISLEPDVTGSTDANNMLELPYTQTVQLEPAGVYGSSKTLSMTCNLSKYFGENVLKATSIYRGDAVSNPTEQAYYHLKCFGVKGGSAEVFITVKIEYSAMFTEPRELLPSLSEGILNLIINDKPEQVSQPSPETKTEPAAPGMLSFLTGK